MLARWKSLQRENASAITEPDPQRGQQADRNATRSRSTLSKSRSRNLSQSGLDAEEAYQAAIAPVYGKMSRAAHVLAQQAARGTRNASRISHAAADDGEESESVLSGRSSHSWCERFGSIKAYSETDAGSLQEAVEDVETGELLELGPPDLPAFLQTASLAMEAAQNPDEVAEQVAVSPGPLGEAVSADAWFESTVVGQLLDAWKDHANRIDATVRSSVSVNFAQGGCDRRTPRHQYTLHDILLNRVSCIDGIVIGVVQMRKCKSDFGYSQFRSKLPQAKHMGVQMIQVQHTHTLEEVGKIRGFDPERLREIARTFADSCQQATYQFVQTTRADTVKMAQNVFQAVHSTYKRGFLNTVKGKSKEQQRVLKAQRELSEGKLLRARAAAQVELAQTNAELDRCAMRLQTYRTQLRDALEAVRPDIKTCMDPDRELVVLCETVASLQETRKIADAYQAKYHEQLVECEHLHGDLKRAQVEIAKSKEQILLMETQLQ